MTCTCSAVLGLNLYQTHRKIKQVKDSFICKHANPLT